MHSFVFQRVKLRTLWKTNSCKLIPNCTRSHFITYTNMANPIILCKTASSDRQVQPATPHLYMCDPHRYIQELLKITVSITQLLSGLRSGIKTSSLIKNNFSGRIATAYITCHEHFCINKFGLLLSTLFTFSRFWKKIALKTFLKLNFRFYN